MHACSGIAISCFGEKSRRNVNGCKLSASTISPTLAVRAAAALSASYYDYDFITIYVEVAKFSCYAPPPVLACVRMIITSEINLQSRKLALSHPTSHIRKNILRKVNPRCIQTIHG